MREIFCILLSSVPYKSDSIITIDSYSNLIEDAKPTDSRQIQAAAFNVERRWDTFTENNNSRSSQDSRGSQAVKNDCNDRQVALNRYRKAVDQLKEAIKIHKSPLGSLDFDELSDEPENFDDLQFRHKINAILISRETSIQDRQGWSKFTYAVECVFTALSPLAKNFLTATKDAQSVMI